MITLTVNGVLKNYLPEDAPKTILELIEQQKLYKKTVVAEVNGTIIPLDQYESSAIENGMVIELVQFVGGG